MLSRKRCCCGPTTGHGCGGCTIPDTFYLTDSSTTFAMTWDLVLQKWRGCHTMDVSGITACQCFNGDPTEGSVTLLITYQAVTVNDATNCYLQITRDWGACSISGEAYHYCAGTIGNDPSLSDCPDGSIDIGEDCDGSGYPVTCAVGGGAGEDTVSILMDADHCLPQSATMTLTTLGTLTSPLAAEITIDS